MKERITEMTKLINIIKIYSTVISEEEATRISYILAEISTEFSFDKDGVYSDFRYDKKIKLSVLFKDVKNIKIQKDDLILNLNLKTWLDKAKNKNSSIDAVPEKEIASTIFNKIKMEEKRADKKQKKEKYLLGKLVASEFYNDMHIGTYAGESFAILESTKTIEDLNKICKTKNFDKVLEILGIESYGFSDEFYTCYRCNKIIHAYNHSYTEHLVLDGCEIICSDCFETEDIEEFLGKHKKSIPNFFFENIKEELQKDGWVEKGSYRYQMGERAPDTKEIMNSYADADTLFVTTGFNMFGCDFELWVKEEI